MYIYMSTDAILTCKLCTSNVQIDFLLNRYSVVDIQEHSR
jgi:hypothetical protein